MQTLDILGTLVFVWSDSHLHSPLHSLRSLVRTRRHDSQHLPQSSHFLDCISNIRRQTSRYLLPHNTRNLRTISICADHDLERTVPVHRAEVEVTLWRYVCDICRYALLLAKFPNDTRRFRIVYSGEDHGYLWIIEVVWLKHPVYVVDFILLHSVSDFIVESLARADQSYFGVGVKKIQNATCSDLYKSISPGALCRVMHCLPYLSSADDEYALIADLPGEDE